MPLVTVDEALALVLEHVLPLPAEEVAAAESAGRVLATDVVAQLDLPRFPSSAMDGYAVRAADTPATLPLVGRIAAGVPVQEVLRPGTTLGIATGGVVPEGADAVVPLELVEIEGELVQVPPTDAGAHVRPIGGDIARGAVVATAGTRIGAAHVAALVASGANVVRCARRPRVTVISTGTELRQAGEHLGDGEIYDSNGPMLRALLSGVADVRRLSAIPDDPGLHRAALADALESDVVVTTGGVSVGPHDLVRATLGELGVREVFWGVAMRPGKPLAFGVRDGTLVFGLPGNPVSSFASATLFVVPALRALQGAAEVGPSYLAGRLAEPVRPRPEREDFLRAIVDAHGSVTPLRGQESHMIVEAARANALVRIPRGDDALPAGAAIDYLALER